MTEPDNHEPGTDKSRTDEPRDEDSFRPQGFDLLLDASGLVCPEPVMMLHGAVRELASGKILKVVTTDPSTRRDIPKFCSFLGHELLSSEELEESFLYFIRRA